jgi:hypothetical protein
MELLERSPSLDVEINLFVVRDEHWDRQIPPNDEIDLGFPPVAIPYCQTVVTEKFWTHVVQRVKLDSKYKTHFGHDLDQIMLSLCVS